MCSIEYNNHYNHTIKTLAVAQNFLSIFLFFMWQNYYLRIIVTSRGGKSWQLSHRLFWKSSCCSRCTIVTVHTVRNHRHLSHTAKTNLLRTSQTLLYIFYCKPLLYRCMTDQVQIDLWPICQVWLVIRWVSVLLS